MIDTSVWGLTWRSNEKLGKYVNQNRLGVTPRRCLHMLFREHSHHPPVPCWAESPHSKPLLLMGIY